MDPGQLEFELDRATLDYGLRAAWTADRIPGHGVAAFNAGHFIAGIPWGWLVLDGVERKEPGTGRLVMSFVVDANGAPALVTSEELPAARARAPRFAFQSYPMLLRGNGEMPWELRAPGRGVSLTHRDSRLALGMLRDGTVVIALSRFAGIGAAGERCRGDPPFPRWRRSCARWDATAR